MQLYPHLPPTIEKESAIAMCFNIKHDNTNTQPMGHYFRIICPGLFAKLVPVQKW